MKVKSFIVAILCPIFHLAAQPLPLLKPLAIGDTLPPVIFNDILNYENTTARFSDFKAPLVILDFWATWCTSCLQGFPKLEALQQEFKQDLQVVLVNSKITGDNEKKIGNFFTKHKNSNGQPYRFPVIIADTLLTQLFAHKLIPHYVWLLQGRVKAITSADEINAANISAMLSAQPPALKIKSDILDYNRDVPLFVNGNAGTGENILARSLFTGYLLGLSSGGSVGKHPNGQVSRMTFVNKSVVDLYRQAWQFHRPASRILLPYADLNSLIMTNWDAEKQDKLFCYEIVLPPVGPDSVYRRMQQDLQNFFGYTATLQNRITKCLVLQCSNKEYKKAKRPKKIDITALTDEFVTIKDQPLSVLVDHLNYYLPLPVIDETGHPAPITIQLPPDITDLDLLQTILRGHGFELKEQCREIEMFILTKK